MKIATIGDTHGKDFWKKINPDEYDKIIFIGDYVDSYDIPMDKIAKNLVEIIIFKKKYPDKVELLLGNHDVQYLTYIPESWTLCSGFNPAGIYVYGHLFEQNKHLFKIAYLHKDYLWTHAGVHSGWYDRFLRRIGVKLSDISMEPPHEIDELLNLGFELLEESIFDIGMIRGGRQDVGGPLWVDKRVMYKPIKEYKQIVGHTHIDKIQTLYDVTFVDNEAEEIYIIDI